ncbi:MAG: T9SS type A sorting domain-containing protein [Bacteroidales bacterium]|nr:T9SS type A sorting domain-containing protein [Bacteroidales bacterium]
MFKTIKTTASIVVLAILLGWTGSLQAQQAITCFGGDVTGSTGSVSFSGGEVAVKTATARAITVVDVTESFTEGVQQPFTERDRAHQGIDQLAVGMTIYPNPTTDNVVLECDESAGQLTYTLYGTNGQVLQKGIYKGGQHQIEMEQYGAGNYMLQIATTDNAKMNVYKIIKAK